MTSASGSLPIHPRVSRRRFLQMAATVGALAAVSVAPSGPEPELLADDAVAQTYHRVLLRHTRWAETQWDEAAGHYRTANFSFAVVLGNALVLTRGTFDEALAGIDAETLKAHTVATLSHFAASNRLVGGTEWGKTLYFDSTFELYFQLAGRLLWNDLDATTRANLDQLAQLQATYTASLGTGDDPRSPGWTTNGLAGGWIGDTKLEEMGVYAQSLAPGLAWAPNAPDAAAWRTRFGQWSRNQTGLPVADLANPTIIDGVAVSANTARNLYDTFVVENHGSFGPHYQCELWRTSARNCIHFMIAGQPIPEVMRAQPNGDRLWRSILSVMSDAGEPLMPMVNDREHLYGRDVIPLAFLAQVLGDRSAAWAESAMADRFEAYQQYPPQYRITKFSGEPKYEPEARAEVAISYLLHEWRARSGEPVVPLSKDDVFAAASGVIDFGAGPGLLSHQSKNSWAGAVSRAGYVKFAWQPAHDDWLFLISGATPMFLPSTAGTVRKRSVAPYTALRDGFDGSATVLGFDTGWAGFATLPGGSVVYATSGVAAGEGHLEVYNLTMPGVPGLDGSRTYTAAEGTVTVASQDSGGATPPPGVARVDTVTFPTTTAQWVRMLGVEPHPTYGYSIFEFEVRNGAAGPNLTLGKPTTASSADTGRGAALATDGTMTTRWAVSRADRPRAASWLAVDLGGPRTFDRVVIYWEAASGRRYRVQVSDDGVTWRDIATYPQPNLSSTGGWLDIDGRASLVVRGSANPITVTGNVITLSDGPAAPLLVEGYPRLDPGQTQAVAAQPAPTTSQASVRASTAEGQLSLFNLSGSAATATVSLPQSRTSVQLYAGTQTITATGTDYAAVLKASSAEVLAPRFTMRTVGEGELPVGLHAEVIDGQRLRLSGPTCQVSVSSPAAPGDTVVVVDTQPRDIVLPEAPAYPLTNLALGRVTFPTSPLPPGMSDPGAAVDGQSDTAWTPGVDGRMVVDLGQQQALGSIELDWTGDRSPTVDVATSIDGITYTHAVRLPAGRDSALLTGAARYVAVRVAGWRPGDPSLHSLVIQPT
ncbi:discoidin domain-containing protein [Micromonospora olivasterospora]|nr:discoidin domain-containing protein [Micromonospora olivasterospora]